MARTYVALLRGINVGRAKRVAMADLRALAEDAGYGRVRTLLNSGNVVFTGRAAGHHARTLEAAIARQLGIIVPVVVVTAAELATIVDENPLVSRATDRSRLMVAFTRDVAALDLLAGLREGAWSPEALAVGTRAAYLWCPAGVIDSPLANAMARALGDAVTTRNWATVLKLHALATSNET